MILHNPSEIPQIEELGFMLPVGFELGVAFKPIIYDASPDIRSIDLQKRMCYFNDERFLKYYRTYSNANCKMECLVNKTIEQCGCVPYHYPKSDETRICHHVNDLCSMRVKDSMEALLSETDEKDFCDCLPSCFRLDFEKVISYAQIINKTRPPDHYLHNKSRTYIRNNIIAVDVYFEVTDFSRFTKNELYGSSDIIASVGGLLGLFLGFSILSIVEVLYYVTLKLWCKIVRDKKKEKIDNKIIPVMPLHKMAKLKY
ncbi:hypothetical protein FQR65_LT10269 [Abscondita terminalis]|nr:hypothetical protein FQR65_LT10269 [Abscondita terminalis]